MKFDYEEKKQLIQLAKYMREGNKLFPKQIMRNLFSENGEEACALGCVLSMIDPDARNKYLLDCNDSYKLLYKTFPILNKDYNEIETLIFDLNDSSKTPITEIADEIEALTYEQK